MLPLKQFLHLISWWHGSQMVIMVIMVFFRHTNIEFQHGITQYVKVQHKKCNGTVKTSYNINKRLQCVKYNFSKLLSKSISLFSDSSLNC